MFRVGIIGSDNSHALAFSRLANIPDGEGEYAFPDVRITGIFGNLPSSFSLNAFVNKQRSPSVLFMFLGYPRTILSTRYSETICSIRRKLSLSELSSTRRITQSP